MASHEMKINDSHIRAVQKESQNKANQCGKSTTRLQNQRGDQLIAIG